MLLANRTVAESIGKVKKGLKPKTLPYRIHDQPDPQKLETLRGFVVKFGYKMKTAGTKGAISKSLNTLMDECQGKKHKLLDEFVGILRAYTTCHGTVLRQCVAYAETYHCILVGRALGQV